MPERQSSPGEGTARPAPDVTENRGGPAPEAQPSAPAGTTEQAAAAPAPGSAGDASGAGRGPGQAGRGTGTSAAGAARPSPQPAPRPTPRPPAGPAPRPSAAQDEASGQDGAESPTVKAAVGPTVETPAGDESPTVRTPNGAADGAGNGSATWKVPVHTPGRTAPAATGDGTTVAVRAAAPPVGSSWFTPVDAEATQAIPRMQAAPQRPPEKPASQTPSPSGPPPSSQPSQPVSQPSGQGAPPLQPAQQPRDLEQATERIPVIPPPPPPPPPGSVGPGGGNGGGGTGERGERPPRAKRRLLVLGGVLGALALLYVADLVFSSNSMPRGVTVAGVPVGSLGLADAEQRLRTEIEPRTTRPIQVGVGQATSEIDPVAAGLAVDWAATMSAAGSQPLNPIARVTSFFTQREVGVVTDVDPSALDAALQELAPVVDRAPIEGSVRFEGLEPQPVDPIPGHQLDVPAAAQVMERDWASGRAVALPLTQLPPSTAPDDVAAVIERVARPAVSAPVTVVGENGTQGTINPEVIAAALLFRAEGGTLVPEINQQVVVDALTPQLAASERPGNDASIDFSSGSPEIVPSQDGRGVDYQATLAGLLDVLTGTGPRQLTAVYADQPAELTTEELEGMGITGVIGEFSTGGFASDSGKNIKRAAEQINGMVVQPGETFSLNEATVPRNAANGYVEAGIISDGHASRGVAGGVSQVATTLYNAAYFAGMVDVHHQEHSFFISRYPPGREATVFEGSIDLKWRNDNPTGVMIQTAWTPSSLTVRLYGTKRYEVTSTPGPRTNPTPPHSVTIPAGEPCSPSQGAPGFTITDTRTLREVSTGEVRNEKRTVRYNPSPAVVCGG